MSGKEYEWSVRTFGRRAQIGDEKGRPAPGGFHLSMQDQLDGFPGFEARLQRFAVRTRDGKDCSRRKTVPL